MAADFFVVPTQPAACCSSWSSSPTRRRIVHVAVTDHPTAAWTAQQLREAFPWDEAPRYLVVDRDHAFDAWAKTATAMDINDLRTVPHSSWQNAYPEGFIGSVRRECLDHIIVCTERGYPTAHSQLSFNCAVREREACGMIHFLSQPGHAHMTVDPELASLIEQAARNLETLAALVRLREQSSEDVDTLRRIIERLKASYTRETNAITQAVLRNALERRTGFDRRQSAPAISGS